MSSYQGFPEDSVVLDGKEFVQAAHAGLLRRCENLIKGVRPRHCCSDHEGWSRDIDGCIGEVVVAKMLNVYWSPGKLGSSDLDWLGIEVRSSRHDRPHLLLHDDDIDDKPYVLVWLQGNKGYAAGWLLSREGKLKEYWREPPAVGSLGRVLRTDREAASILGVEAPTKARSTMKMKGEDS